ncbi:hypothetical protein AB0F13_24595 [Streptomyces sp. NPDC026206]|uniref:hypothetical protein n=1 Tax=Streptomyces sp. NPDC026206 TaxID=3157089 RepID=UPI0033E8C748
MMQDPPSVPLLVWWVVAVASTAIFLLFFVPLMPNQRYKTRISLAPLAGITFVAVSSLAKSDGLGVALPIYSSAILAFPLGFLGHRNELREKALEMARDGKQSPENGLSQGLQLQLVLVIVVMVAIGAWFSMSS